MATQSTIFRRVGVKRINDEKFAEELIVLFGSAFVSTSQSRVGYLPDGLTEIMVILNDPPANYDSVIDTALAAHDPLAKSAAQLAAEEHAADKAAMVQAQADQAIADIDTEIADLNSPTSGLPVLRADLLAWDGMTNVERAAATKRMLIGVIALGDTMIFVLQLIRKIIKFVRWL